MSATVNDLLKAWLLQQLPAGILDTVQPMAGGATSSNSAGTFQYNVIPGSTFGRTSLNPGSSGLVTGSTADLGTISATPMAVIMATGALTAGAFSIEGSIDGNNWYKLGTAPNTDFVANSLNNMYAFAGKPCRQMRVNITTALAGGTVTALCAAGA